MARHNNGSTSLQSVKDQILIVLQHPEADEGLFFRNFAELHEEDERPAVEASEVAILDALRELIEEGKVRIDETGEEVVFHCAKLGGLSSNA